MSEITVPSRMHPSAPIVGFLFDLRKAVPMMLGVIPALFIGARGFIIAGLMALAVATLASPVVRYLTTTYHVAEGTLIINSGLFFKSRRVVPRARIQSVDQVRRLWHQILGVVELRVEAIGGSKTEARLDAVTPEVAEAIQRWALEEGPETQDPLPKQPNVLAKASVRILLLAGLTGGRVAVITVMLGYGLELLGDEMFSAVFDSARKIVGDSGVGLLVLGAVGALLVALAISLISTVVIFWNFTLAWEGERLIITKGLLERRRASIPKHRIQAVRIDENLIRKALGLASLSLHVAGYAGDSSEVQRSSVLLPLGSRDEALRIAGEVIGAPEGIIRQSLLRPPRRALWKRIGLVSSLAVAAGVAGFITWGASGVSLGLIVVPGWALAYLAYRFLGHSVEGGWAMVSNGILAKKTSVIPVRNVQHLSYTRGPIDRALGLCDLVFSIPRKSVTAEDLDSEVGEDRFGVIERALLSP